MKASGDNGSPMWHIVEPIQWPDIPQYMSFSLLNEIETCPHKWALHAANYPQIWNRRGYPRRIYYRKILGIIVHLSLNKILSAFSEACCSSIRDKKAVEVIRELGGYSKIVKENALVVLDDQRSNPRVERILPLNIEPPRVYRRLGCLSPSAFS